jgi:hypothetical protein
MPDYFGSSVSRLAIATLLLVTILGSTTGGQTRDPHRVFNPDKRGQAPPSLPAQYFYLLRLQLHLDQEADRRQQRGLQKEAEELRSHVQGQLHFRDDQAAILRQVATEYDDMYRAINIEVAPIAKADRDWVKAHGKAAGPPPNRAQVRDFGLRRKAALEDAIRELNSRLGPDGAAQVQSYLARIFSPENRNTRLRFYPPLHLKLHAPPGVNNPNSGSGVANDLHGEASQ